jgi:hypothetical protein
MTQNLAPTVLAGGGELVDGALETIEHVSGAEGDNLEGELIIVAANFTDSHGMPHQVMR